VSTTPETLKDPARPEHTPLMEASLVVDIAQDKAWLELFGITVDEEFLQNLQTIINEDTEDLRHDQTSFSQSISARQRFYDLIGLPYIDNADDEPTNARTDLQDKKYTLAPLNTTIRTFRVMSDFELDVPKIINTMPSTVGYAPESVQAKVENFKTLGLNYVKIINALPSAIGYAPESVRAKVDNFKTLGLDYIEIINKLPSAIGLAPETVQAKVDNFKTLGLNYIEIINKMPSAINLAPEKIKSTKRLLKRVGRWDEIKNDWNQGKKLEWLILPVESMIIALGNSKGHKTTSATFKNASKVNKHVKPLATTRKERISYVKDRVGSLDTAKSNEETRKFANNLGAVVLLGLFRQSRA